MRIIYWLMPWLERRAVNRFLAGDDLCRCAPGFTCGNCLRKQWGES